jgi:hypothetical protein
MMVNTWPIQCEQHLTELILIMVVQLVKPLKSGYTLRKVLRKKLKRAEYLKYFFYQTPTTKGPSCVFC